MPQRKSIFTTNDHWTPRKIVIVGAGAVASTFGYALAQSGLAEEIVLTDANHELQATLPPDEQNAFVKSAGVLQAVIKQLERTVFA